MGENQHADETIRADGQRTRYIARQGDEAARADVEGPVAASEPQVAIEDLEELVLALVDV